MRRSLVDSLSAVLIAPPGAGKTTLVPLRLLDEPWLQGRRVVMLEPRRLAARAAARRISALVGDEPGGLVGFQTRDERVIGADTRLEIVTEGILTRRLQSDPSIDGCGLVIFDEVHERNLPTDLGMALCLDSRRTIRPDLRIVAMSATADAGQFAGVLGSHGRPAPVVTSQGRMFDVDIVWLPMSKNQRLDEAAARAIGRALHDNDGDVLVFLPGIADIERVRRRLQNTPLDPTVDIRLLAGALTPQEQDLALSASAPGRRRIVLSTDIAETSLTVDGIRVVVDAGLARVLRFDARTGMTRLTTVPASRASCDQRTGRAGRVAPGVAYRLWSKLEHGTRRSHLDPEIAQADLASFALDVAAWGTPIEDLAFVQAPPPSALGHARDLLGHLGALDPHGAITPLGRSMLDLPVHPRLAKMIRSAQPDDLSLACILATLVEERDILRGSPDTKPVDLLVRVLLVKGSSTVRGDGEFDVDPRAMSGLRSRAEELCRRAGSRIDWNAVDADHSAALLLLAYPDRVAIRRQPGQFQMISGTSAWVQRSDPLAEANFLVAVDLDGNPKSARIRMGVSVHEHDLYRSMGDQIEEDRQIKWDKERGDIVEHLVVRIGNMRVSESRNRPVPSEETTEALFQHLAQRRFSLLLDKETARNLVARVVFLRTASEPHADLDQDWPDWSRSALVASARDWLRPLLTGMTSIAEVEALDPEMLLRSQLSWDRGALLDELAPESLLVSSGRRVHIDYATALEDGTAPTIDIRVQDLFGTRTHPAILAGRVPLVLRLLSPADRPIQVTADLPGFWRGSWADVRKELSGRYPKHNWPVDPENAEPKRTKDR